MSNDTTTTLNAGTLGDVMNESRVIQSDGITAAKSPRVVIGDDSDGRLLYGAGNPFPINDAFQRQANERATLLSLSKLDVNISQRYGERLRHGDRLDLIDSRGPGGR